MKHYLTIPIIFLLLATLSCKDDKNEQVKQDDKIKEMNNEQFFKLSLAQWSLNENIRFQGMDPFDFARIADSLEFEGLEYVSQLYKPFYEKNGIDALVKKLAEESKKYNQNNILIMVDNEGDLADPDEAKRDEAVELHKKWVDAAAALGCHSIRVNTFGTNDPDIWHNAVVDGLKKLSTYAATKNVNVLCENHGWLSSDPDKLMKALNEVNMENCGTLPDFGNWCIKRKDGENWGECEEEYTDKYKGIELLMPKAKAVSAKSYAFDENGNETTLDYVRILQIVKDAGYRGYIGVEFEGGLPEEEGIVSTKNLLISANQKLK
ncbi:sugar phosphate isomerase/epimerase family protein [Winogradskyella sp. PG-2]|uniref:sugar phosphate isomerase/epimerase family protein n=1 Tax=Winogradskyella sp. PG-2 TaxID=754409 RepID=UPI0004585E8D|nr:sugar phosphate isomerase/epimerase family protein [Winogradskyella sp. PG-2]BAO76129.1 hypothetical protein WPG_1899 [Winogradskyella sp. PG-2]